MRCKGCLHCVVRKDGKLVQVRQHDRPFLTNWGVIIRLFAVALLGLSVTACETIKTGQVVYDDQGNMYERQMIVHYPYCAGSCAERVKQQHK